MSEQLAFGRTLRRMRVEAGVSLRQVSARTNVSVELWEAMEQSDFSQWPGGLYSRAFI